MPRPALRPVPPAASSRILVVTVTQGAKVPMPEQYGSREISITVQGSVAGTSPDNVQSLIDSLRNALHTEIARAPQDWTNARSSARR